MIWRILLLCLSGALAGAAEFEQPSEFYIVTQGYAQKNSYGAGEYQELLSVVAAGGDSIIRSVRIEHVFQGECGRASS